MATRWIDTIKCQMCGGEARTGVEKEGQGSTHRVICRSCGIAEHVGMGYFAGQKIDQMLKAKQSRFGEWI